MYLSRIILNPRSRRVQRELANPYQMHKTLMRCFPDGLDRKQDRVLFRVDTDKRTGLPVLLLQSTLEPQWGWLSNAGARDYLLPRSQWPPTIADNPDVKTFRLHLQPGQTLAYRLRANPTVKKSEPNQRQGKRVGLVREEDQRAWLVRKGQRGGFQPLTVAIAREGNVGGWVKRSGKRHKLTLLAVRFDGLLQVTDPDRLWATVKQGIGSGKGFGFGLLSLAPPR